MGSWDNWEKEINMKKSYNHMNKSFHQFAEVYLLPGKYFYKFKTEENEYIHDPNYKTVKNKFETYDNFIFVKYT